MVLKAGKRNDSPVAFEVIMASPLKSRKDFNWNGNFMPELFTGLLAILF